jgi:hypothetical protein
LVVDEEIKLPEGTELELVIDDEGADLDERELAGLERGALDQPGGPGRRCRSWVRCRGGDQDPDALDQPWSGRDQLGARVGARLRRMSDDQAPGDGLEPPADSDAERARIVAKVERSLAQLRAGRGVSHAEVVAMIEQRYPASGQESAATEVEAERAALVAAVEAGRVHTHADVRGAMAARFDGLDRATLADVTDEADRILDAALQLPERERAELAVMLTDSIGDGSSPEEVRASWLAEVQRRREALARGEETLVDFDDMMARLRAKVHRSRERRASTG